MTTRTLFPVMLSALLAISCSTATTQPVEFSKAERVLGLDDDVRVEAIVYASPIQRSGVKIICEVENRRPEPILIYDVQSIAVYDPETQTFTVNLGSEIPATDREPIQILSSERRRFEQTVSLSSVPPVFRRVTNFVKVRLHFLGEAIGISSSLDGPTPGVMQWAEHKRTVDTNSVPMF